MATVVNFIDTTLQAAPSRTTVFPADVGGYLTRGAVTLAAAADGTVASFALAAGTFAVTDDGADKTGDAAVTYSVASQTGCTVSITAAGAYSVSAMSADTASATLRAVYGGATVDRLLSLSKARAGGTGGTGSTGPRGNVQISATTTGSAWSDTEAVAAISAQGFGTPRAYDTVTLVNNSSGFVATKLYDGSAWTTLAAFINGNMLVNGTVYIHSASGDVVIGPSTPLNPAFAAPGTLNSDLTASITAAQSAADAANAAITAISSDNVLSKGEKPQVILDWNAIDGEKTGLDAQASALGVSATAYDNAYTALANYLVGLGPSLEWANTAVDTVIVGSTFRSKFTDYYAAKQALLNAVAGKIQSNAAAAAVSVFSPKMTWEFRSTLDGWSFAGGTTTQNADSITIASNTSDPILSAPALSINGALYDKIRIRLRRLAGSAWQGQVYYSTSNHSASESYTKMLGADPTIGGAWTIIEADMSNLSAGGTDWTSNTIIGLRLDLGNSSTDSFEVDWISIGKYGPAASPDDVADKISKTAGGILSGPVSLTTGGSVVVGTAAWTGAVATGTGVVTSPKGIAAVYGGVPTFTLDGATGAAWFAGQLAAAWGTFGSVTIATGGYLRSANYSAGSAGFTFNSDGTGEMSSLLLRGNPTGPVSNSLAPVSTTATTLVTLASATAITSAHTVSVKASGLVQSTDSSAGSTSITLYSGDAAGSETTVVKTWTATSLKDGSGLWDTTALAFNETFEISVAANSSRTGAGKFFKATAVRTGTSSSFTEADITLSTNTKGATA